MKAQTSLYFLLSIVLVVLLLLIAVVMVSSVELNFPTFVAPTYTVQQCLETATEQELHSEGKRLHTAPVPVTDTRFQLEKAIQKNFVQCIADNPPLKQGNAITTVHFTEETIIVTIDSPGTIATRHLQKELPSATYTKELHFLAIKRAADHIFNQGLQDIPSLIEEVDIDVYPIGTVVYYIIHVDGMNYTVVA